MRVLHPQRRSLPFAVLPDDSSSILRRRLREGAGLVLIAASFCAALALATWSVDDPSFSHATGRPAANFLGEPGAALADILMQLVGLASIPLVATLALWGWRLLRSRSMGRARLRAALWLFGTLAAAAAAAALPRTAAWPLPSGLGGMLGDLLMSIVRRSPLMDEMAPVLAGVAGLGAAAALFLATGAMLQARPPSAAPAAEPADDADRGWVSLGLVMHWLLSAPALLRRVWNGARGRRSTLAISPLSEVLRRADEPMHAWPQSTPDDLHLDPEPDDSPVSDGQASAEAEPAIPFRPSRTPRKRISPAPERHLPGTYGLPQQALLVEPRRTGTVALSADALDQNARALEGVLEDFGVRGEIINSRPGPVVTLYELEPAPGIKSSRVIGLADDIARSMSAVSARVAVVPGRNVIGIELPNPRRETVYLRELLTAEGFTRAGVRLPLCLGKTIGGEPVIADLARMPHLLIAGTTGSGKSVAINTMILSLVYRLRPDECRLIMIDPKMLELSGYDGIPHLLSPVVTDPKKAVIALKWAVREMEDRYRKMSKLGVRNIDGFNARVVQATEKGEAVTRTVQTGFDRTTGEAVYEQEVMHLQPLPYVVVIVDEMADLMMVAGKEIEGAIQRLAQMARAAGIHLIMATQRPSVDVITGTIKANFPTRISFQVTSKIDSRTILGEQGAEQLLGQGDMLHMAGGGRISRVHGPFVSDEEVERVVAYLKTQGQPDYLDAVTADPDEGGEDDGAVFDKGSFGEEGNDLYDQALAVVLRDKKCSTSYIQRRLQIGYNRAASLVERMEKEGVVGPANHAGKREILLETQDRLDV